MWEVRFLLLPKRLSHCGHGNSPSSGKLGVPDSLRISGRLVEAHVPLVVSLAMSSASGPLRKLW